MTKEEAIFCEKSYIGETNCTDCKYYGTDTCQSRVSHKMAIKALGQESCKDAVSRQAVLNTLDFTDKFLDETRTVESYKTLLEECYKNLPPVIPTHIETVTEFADRCRECEKQKKGKWE